MNKTALGFKKGLYQVWKLLFRWHLVVTILATLTFQYISAMMTMARVADPSCSFQCRDQTSTSAVALELQTL